MLQKRLDAINYVISVKDEIPGEKCDKVITFLKYQRAFLWRKKFSEKFSNTSFIGKRLQSMIIEQEKDIQSEVRKIIPDPLYKHHSELPELIFLQYLAELSHDTNPHVYDGIYKRINLL